MSKVSKQRNKGGHTKDHSKFSAHAIHVQSILGVEIAHAPWSLSCAVLGLDFELQLLVLKKTLEDLEVVLVWEVLGTLTSGV